MVPSFYRKKEEEKRKYDILSRRTRRKMISGSSEDFI
jgi:hypothetical protein